MAITPTEAAIFIVLLNTAITRSMRKAESMPDPSVTLANRDAMAGGSTAILFNSIADESLRIVIIKAPANCNILAPTQRLSWKSEYGLEYEYPRQSRCRPSHSQRRPGSDSCRRDLCRLRGGWWYC